MPLEAEDGRVEPDSRGGPLLMPFFPGVEATALRFGNQLKLLSKMQWLPPARTPPAQP
jgi:hypothetical protein